MARFVFSAFADEATKDIQGQIAACKKNGITHIELRGVDKKNISEFSVDEARELKKILDEGGIKVSSIGSKYGKIEITDDFEPHFEEFKNTVEVAKILDTKYIRMFSFYFRDGESREEYKDEVIRRVGAMAEYSLEHGILCCHENECGIFGDRPEYCLILHEALGEKLGGIFDPANYIHSDVEIAPAFDMLEPYITYFHVKDAKIADGTVTPAGEGDAGFEDILRRFAQKDGVYFLSVEPHLAVFEGLKSLETSGESIENIRKSPFKYESREESFAAATGAIHRLVEKIQPIRLGVIGIGNMGTSHMRAFRDGRIKEMRLTAVADINPARWEANKDMVSSVVFFNTAEELIDSGLCDAVVIATPHYEHPRLTMYAIEKGLHVMSEKPAGVYTKQVREENEFAAKHDKVFGIMFNQRTNAVYRKLRELVQSGEFGEIRRVSWLITDWFRTQAYYNSGGWRATWSGEGGGVLLNQCPHNLDLWQWICGMPCKIRAVCHEGKWHDIEVEDDVTIYAEYPNGASGVFVTSTGDWPGSNRLEITLDSAKIVCENNEIKLFKTNMPLQQFSDTSSEGFGKPGGEWVEVKVEGETTGHIGVLNRFAGAILRGEPLYAEGYEGINGLNISNAAHLSSWLNREIELPVDEDLFFSELQKKIAASQAKKTVVESVEDDMLSTFGS